jgi:hypothetical protein
MIAEPYTWRGEGNGDCFGDSPGRVLELQLTRDNENIHPGNGILGSGD